MTRKDIADIKANRRRVTRREVAALCDALTTVLDACDVEPPHDSGNGYRIAAMTLRNIVKDAVDAVVLPPPETPA